MAGALDRRRIRLLCSFIRAGSDDAVTTGGATMTTEPTDFQNIDLELYDARPLDEFVAAWGREVFVLHHGEWSEGWRLAVEVSALTRTAETTARELVRLIEGLPPAARARWDGLRDRVFDLGVQTGRTPPMWSTALSAETVAAIGALGARLALTVYAPYDEPVTLPGVAREDVEEDVEGDVEGDIEGDVEGDVEGDIEGDIEEDVEEDVEEDDVDVDELEREDEAGA
ncbi:MAG: hypothetical protein H6713_14690 [Myxococcales bacterium]|nr:hypothetical protein [Myxococcales bacterium]